MFASAALDLKDSREYRRTEVRRAQRAAKDVYIFTTPNPKEVADALENVRMQAQAEGLDADAVAESMLGRSYGTVPDGNTVIAALGETVTAWLHKNSGIEVVDKIVTQSSDAEFHCISITLFYRRAAS